MSSTIQDLIAATALLFDSWMRALGFFLITILYSSLTYGDPGFLRLAFPEITEAARTAGASVFEIHRLDPASRLTLDLQSFGDFYEAKIKEDKLLPRVEKVVLLQLQQCRERKQLKACDVYTNTLYASAFVVDDTRTLMTVMPINGKQTPFAIFNGNGQLIYIGAGAAEPAYANSGSDIVRVRFAIELGKPLIPAVPPVKIGSRVFVAGFPAGTGKYNSHKFKGRVYGLETRGAMPESKGDGIFVSIGKLLEFGADGMFETDADSTIGSQGGPVLNDAGEVIGINLGGRVERYHVGTAVRMRQSGFSLSLK